MGDNPDYPPPLKRLFELDQPRLRWPADRLDYVSQLGIGPEHTAGLVEIVLGWPEGLDEPESVEGWAAPHAWRALAQLQAVEAVEPLLSIMDRLDEARDDWYLAEFPHVFAMIGPAAIPALAAYLADTSNHNFPRSVAATGLKEIGRRHPDAMPQVMSILNGQFARFADSDEEFNALLLCDLMDLKAVDSAGMIERAYAAGKVDEFMVCWEDVERSLGVSGTGLIPDRAPPRPERSPPPMPSDSQSEWRLTPEERQREKQKEKQAKAKRKQQETARKRNRKRR